MTPRQRLTATLNHQTPDRVCVDFGATPVTGIGAGTVYRLRQALLGDSSPVKIIEPYQMLGEIDDDLSSALQLDVVGVPGRKTMFGFPNQDWKPFTMHDGTPVLVPGGFQYDVDANGALLIYPEGDRTARPSAKMPNGGDYFFDSIIRQAPIDEDNLSPADNCEEFGPIGDEDFDHLESNVARRHAGSDYGILCALPGMALGDIALVPGPWMKDPKGIRDVTEWYVSLAARQDYVIAVFERQVEFALDNIRRLAPVLKDKAQVAFVSGTDFGTQQSPFCSTNSFRKLYKPFYKAINDEIHNLIGCKTFIHSCGAVYPLIPEFIEAGFDILNPVQCSANGMDANRLKSEFGKDIVFWGGGVDTQKTLPFGTPDEVFKEVAKRIAIFGEGGGFVFNAIHNVQSNVPLDNLLAMFNAVNEARGIARLTPKGS